MLVLILAALLAPNLQPIAKTPPEGWIQESDYPPAARRAEQEGVVGFRLDIDLTGEPAGCVVTRSSGFPVLDDATCALLMKRARYQPATDGDGRPRLGFVASSIRWKLDRADPTPAEYGGAIAHIVLDKKGVVTSCSTETVGRDRSLGDLCEAMGRTDMLRPMMGDAFKGVAAVDLRLLLRPESDRIASEDAKFSIRRTLSSARIKVSPAGDALSCEPLEARTIGGRTLDICKGAAPGKGDFAPRPAAEGIATILFTLDLVTNPS